MAIGGSSDGSGGGGDDVAAAVTTAVDAVSMSLCGRWGVHLTAINHITFALIYLLIFSFMRFSFDL